MELDYIGSQCSIEQTFAQYRRLVASICAHSWVPAQPHSLATSNDHQKLGDVDEYLAQAKGADRHYGSPNSLDCNFKRHDIVDPKFS